MAMVASASSACNVAWIALRALSRISPLATQRKDGPVRTFRVWYELVLTPRKAVFSLNEPDINGISPSQAASWYIQYINPLVSCCLAAISGHH